MREDRTRRRLSIRDRLLIAAALVGVVALAAIMAIELANSPKASVAGLLVGAVFVTGFFGALLRTDIEWLVGVLRGGQVVLPVLVFSLTSTLMGETAGTLGFDEIGAQVVIVLLLALALDARFFRLRAR